MTRQQLIGRIMSIGAIARGKDIVSKQKAFNDAYKALDKYEMTLEKSSKSDVVRVAYLLQDRATLINYGLFDSEEKAKKYIMNNQELDAFQFGIQEVEIR